MNVTRVIVTVRYLGKDYDLEVPAEVAASELAPLVVAALSGGGMLGAQARYDVEAYPLKRVLRPDETLAAAGVWDGSWLVLKPAADARAEDSSRRAPDLAAPRGPASGWRPLGAPSEQPSSSAEGKRRAGFVWKKLG